MEGVVPHGSAREAVEGHEVVEVPQTPLLPSRGVDADREYHPRDRPARERRREGGRGLRGVAPSLYRELRLEDTRRADRRGRTKVRGGLPAAEEGVWLSHELPGPWHVGNAVGTFDAQRTMVSHGTNLQLRFRDAEGVRRRRQSEGGHREGGAEGKAGGCRGRG